ncbi:CheR family methyltransferase [Fibrobacterota bacterium]
MMIDITDEEFNLLKELLCRISGIDIPANKQYLFKTRLSSFLRDKGYKGFSEFYHVMNTARDGELERTFVQSMTTHESSFFRDRTPFALLEKRLLPEISAQRLKDAVFMPARIKILSAGCSYGQEAYSIAMCVAKWRKSQQEDGTISDVAIQATDISRRVLERAKKGHYTDLEMGNHMPEDFKKEYFIHGESHWEITDEIRQMVSFSEMNLSESFGNMGKFDIIFCRNVIIYFPIELKAKIVKGFFNALNKGGALILGSSENLYRSHEDFESCSGEGAMYFVPRK